MRWRWPFRAIAWCERTATSRATAGESNVSAGCWRERHGGDLAMATQLTLGLPDGPPRLAHERLGTGAAVLRGFALADEDALLADLADVVAAAPFRHMITPGGFRMSVAMTNCGALGWVSAASGYRYAAEDPQSGRAWPSLPESFHRLARGAAAQTGFADFVPDARSEERRVGKEGRSRWSPY